MHSVCKIGSKKKISFIFKNCLNLLIDLSKFRVWKFYPLGPKFPCTALRLCLPAVIVVIYQSQDCSIVEPKCFDSFDYQFNWAVNWICLTLSESILLMCCVLRVLIDSSIDTNRKRLLYSTFSVFVFFCY